MTLIAGLSGPDVIIYSPSPYDLDIAERGVKLNSLAPYLEMCFEIVLQCIIVFFSGNEENVCISPLRYIAAFCHLYLSDEIPCS